MMIKQKIKIFPLWLWGLSLYRPLRDSEKMAVLAAMKNPYKKEALLPLQPLVGNLIDWESLDAVKGYAVPFASAYPAFPRDHCSLKSCWSFRNQETTLAQYELENVETPPHFQTGNEINTLHGEGRVVGHCRYRNRLFYAVEIHARGLQPSFVLTTDSLGVWEKP